MESNIYTFRIIIEPDSPSGYHGFVPLLKGVHTQGETIAETKRNLKEAIICHYDGRRITVPIHKGKDLKKKILRGIIDDLELSVEDFVAILKS